MGTGQKRGGGRTGTCPLCGRTTSEWQAVSPLSKAVETLKEEHAHKLTAGEFRRTAEGHLRLLIQMEEQLAPPPSPAPSAAPSARSEQGHPVSSLDSQCPFGLHTPCLAVSRRITSKCHQPFHLSRILCKCGWVHPRTLKLQHTWPIVSLTSWGASPRAHHVWCRLREFNQLLRKHLKFTEHKPSKTLSQSKMTKHRFSPNTCF